MERSRLPFPCKKMTRHSPRKQTCGRGRGYMYALISLLLFCMLALFHSKLGAISSANATHVARFFKSSPISQQDSTPFKISSVSLQNASFARDVVDTKLENSRIVNGSLPLAQDDDDDEDDDTEVQEEENAEDGEEEQEQEQEEEEEEDDGDGDEEVGLEHDRRKLKDGRKLHDTELNSSTHTSDKMVLGSTGLLSSMSNGKVLTESVNDSERQTQAKKSLLRLGGIKALARWDPLEGMGERSKADNVQRGSNTWHSIGQPFDKNESSRWHGVTWDHLLGVIRKTNTVKGSMTQFTSRKVEPGAQYSIHVPHEVNQSDGSSSHSTQNFGSDDEPSDQSVIDKLEEITSIEDALLLKGKNAFMRLWAERKPSKGDAFKKDRPNKAAFDPLNPINNPLLQDPDTFGSSGLSGSDKVMLKAMRRGKQESARRNADTTPFRKVSEDTLATSGNGTSTHDFVSDAGAQLGNGAERSILELPSSDSLMPSKVVVGSVLSRKSSLESDSSKEKRISSRRKSPLDTRRWGFYTTLDPDLGFSDFMDQFLGDKSCSHNVFMVWTTPPWTYTVRYQRGLESLLYFHPKACIVVFSESIELDFFKSFVADGFRVAVVVPHLEELLDGTPAAMFASFWLSWRKTPLFNIHYPELLRLAALYKYGGIYLDTDVILLKPLGMLHNTIGAETIENQTQKLNGAVMAFDKSSFFLLECLVEFMETYDDQLLDFNGAGLVTRVAKRITEEQNRNSEQGMGDLNVEKPHAFFPLSSEHIMRYFKAPESKQQELETDLLYESIYNGSSMLHFWNQRTHRLVPESGSLVERIINRHCIRCSEYL